MSLDGASIRIIDTDAKIEKNILYAMEKDVKFTIQKAKAKIHSGIINLVVEALSSSPEIVSLSAGKLKADFGLTSDPGQEIIYAVANSVDVVFRDFKMNRQGVKSVLSVYIQPSDFTNLLSAEFAKVVTDKGDQLPWLSWLLTMGDSVIISEFGVQYGNFPTSRSGMAVMKPIGVFKVDSTFAGTIENNFITRALDKYKNQMSEIIGKSL
jgi:hypothetical protein